MARRRPCMNNLKQIGVGPAQLREAHAPDLPPGAITWQESPPRLPLPAAGQPVHDAPEPIEQSAGFNAVNFAFASTGLREPRMPGAMNYSASPAPINTFICPSDCRQRSLLLQSSATRRTAMTYSTYSAVLLRRGGRDGRHLPLVLRLSRGISLMTIVCFGRYRAEARRRLRRQLGAYVCNEFKDGLSRHSWWASLRVPQRSGPVFNEWTSALYFRSSLPGVTRPQGLATTVPQYQRGLGLPDVPGATRTAGRMTLSNRSSASSASGAGTPAAPISFSAMARFVSSREFDQRSEGLPALSTRTGREVVERGLLLSVAIVPYTRSRATHRDEKSERPGSLRCHCRFRCHFSSVCGPSPNVPSPPSSLPALERSGRVPIPTKADRPAGPQPSRPMNPR